MSTTPQSRSHYEVLPLPAALSLLTIDPAGLLVYRVMEATCSGYMANDVVFVSMTELADPADDVLIFRAGNLALKHVSSVGADKVLGVVMEARRRSHAGCRSTLPECQTCTAAGDLANGV